MCLVEVDGVDSEAAKAGVESAGEVRPGEADVVGSVTHRKAALCGNDEPVTHPGPGCEPPTNDLL